MRSISFIQFQKSKINFNFKRSVLSAFENPFDPRSISFIQFQKSISKNPFDPRSKKVSISIL